MITLYRLGTNKQFIVRLLTRKDTTKFTVEYGVVNTLFIHKSTEMPDDIATMLLSNDVNIIKNAVNQYILTDKNPYINLLKERISITHID